MKPIKILRACTVPQSLSFVTDMLPALQEMCNAVLLSSSGPEWIDVKKQYSDVRCIEVNMERHIAPLKDLKSLWQLWLVFRKEKPQMVHSMTPKAGLLCMVAAWVARVPLRVHTFTGLVFPTSTGLKRRILMATDWLTCACATHIIPEGEGVKNDLVNNNITKKPLKVLGYGNVKGIDLEYFDRIASVTDQAMKLRKSDVFTFIFVGRLVGDKGINELVEAFARLNNEFKKTRLVLVGNAERELDLLLPSTIQLIENLESIEAVGKQSDVRAWLAMSDAAILPSYREGFPNVVIEAGAMGLPQIVTDINGSREIIIEGKNGTIVPSHSAEALYVAMRNFVEHPEYVKSLAVNARAFIASRYERSYVQSCLLEFYEEILHI